MPTLRTLAAAAAVLVGATLPALACSGTKADVTAQTPVPAETQQQTAQTPVPPGALTAPTETADAGKPETGAVKAN